MKKWKLVKKVMLVSTVMVMLLSGKLYAAQMKDRVATFNWNGIDVVWVQDEQFPVFNLGVYFADGALSDHKQKSGETAQMFENLTSGTNRYTQEQITDTLDYFGASLDLDVTHEYSVFSASGLLSNMVPAVKMVCHLFKDSVFPSKVIKDEIKKDVDEIYNMVSDHGDLATRVYRAISLSGSPYEIYSSGTIDGLKNIDTIDLAKKLNYFNSNVKKKIYLSGPRDVLKIEDIIKSECGWAVKDKEVGSYVRNVDYQHKKLKKNEIYLVTVPKANQAQFRIGRILDKNEIDNSELMRFSASFLGGSFTSRLMREVRVARGLTYSIGSSAAPQRDYGRANISTFTKNETVGDLLGVVHKVLLDVSAVAIEDEEFERARGYLLGNYLFGFEKSDAYLAQLISLDHMNMKYERLNRFPDIINRIKKEEIVTSISQIFDWDSMYTVVLGTVELKAQLEKFGTVHVVSYDKFL